MKRLANAAAADAVALARDCPCESISVPDLAYESRTEAEIPTEQVTDTNKCVGALCNQRAGEGKTRRWKQKNSNNMCIACFKLTKGESAARSRGRMGAHRRVWTKQPRAALFRAFCKGPLCVALAAEGQPRKIPQSGLRYGGMCKACCTATEANPDAKKARGSAAHGGRIPAFHRRVRRK